MAKTGDATFRLTGDLLRRRSKDLTGQTDAVTCTLSADQNDLYRRSERGNDRTGNDPDVCDRIQTTLVIKTEAAMYRGRVMV
jgi:hypothetical protein